MGFLEKIILAIIQVLILGSLTIFPEYTFCPTGFLIEDYSVTHKTISCDCHGGFCFGLLRMYITFLLGDINAPFTIVLVLQNLT